MKHIIKSQDFTKKEMYSLFKKADELRKKNKESLKGKILATLFYEPSTRTRLSFESAVQRLGGKLISVEDAKDASSAKKGESIEDTIRTIGKYCDCIVMRHFEQGSAEKASMVSEVPIINAGDGKGQHPTQALLDMYTIYKELKRLENLNIAIVGDLANGRTVNSLCYILSNFKNNKITLISPKNLELKKDVKDFLNKNKIKFSESNNLNKILPSMDVIYMTRIQKEKISKKDYGKAKGKYIINMKNFNLINKNSILMHPLVKQEEIDLPIEIEQKDKRVAYF
ncbi:MAG: aspartate carbamoyltransferase, partial [bacterium]